ncbi:MAG TPA: hypothetical protein VGP89_10340, partial [Candidatus Angelobacter sp.]|nr:hypothetical protein [Candidatus Angelobacter sp.]
ISAPTIPAVRPFRNAEGEGPVSRIGSAKWVFLARFGWNGFPYQHHCIGSSKMTPQEQAPEDIRSKVPSADHFPTSQILVINDPLEAGGVQHAQEQLLGVGSNMGRIQPKNLADNGYIFRIGGHQQKFAART